MNITREALPILIDRLPTFNSHWSPERIDQWFGWFFDLLEAVKKPPMREAVAADFGLPAQGIEAATAAETAEETGSVHESTVGEADAPTPPHLSQDKSHDKR